MENQAMKQKRERRLFGNIWFRPSEKSRKPLFVKTIWDLTQDLFSDQKDAALAHMTYYVPSKPFPPPFSASFWIVHFLNWNAPIKKEKKQ